jgi:hypothetical protein
MPDANKVGPESVLDSTTDKAGVRACLFQQGAGAVQTFNRP